MAKQKKDQAEAPVYAGMTKDQVTAEIVSAESVEKLDEIWSQLHAVGWSTEGLTYALILERKAELGEEVDEEAEALIKLAKLRRARAKDLPSIEGTGGEKVKGT